MPAKSTKSKPAAKPATIKKSAPKPKAVAPKPPAFEIWRCHVDWVKYHGKKYEKGDILNVARFTLTDEAEMRIIRKYFTPTKTESVKMVSEPIEILKEGESHGNSSD